MGHALHLVFGNALIRIAEGLLLAQLFKLHRKRCVGWNAIQLPDERIIFNWATTKSAFSTLILSEFRFWLAGEAPLFC